MPVVDWTRTNLNYELGDGARALAFDMLDFIVFDVFILRRPGAEKEFDYQMVEKAKQRYESMNREKRYELEKTIIAGLPGAEESYSLEQFQSHLNEYREIDNDRYREHLSYFLERVAPVAEQSGVKLVGMVERHGAKLNFAHLRSTQRSIDGSFHEAAHLRGDVDMYGVILAILKEQRKRQAAYRPDDVIPMRADHGHTILDDLQKKTNPGYSAIGLLRGMAELRGLEMGIEKSNAVFNS